MINFIAVYDATGYEVALLQANYITLWKREGGEVVSTRTINVTQLDSTDKIVTHINNRYI
jgi:hypothetical protein